MRRYKYRKVIIVDGIRHDIRAHSISELMDKINKIKSEENPKNPTLKEWVDICFKTYKSGITPYAYYVEYNCIKKHILDYIGTVKVKSITPLMCQKVINKTEGLSAYTIKRVTELFSFCMKKATVEGIIMRNPVEGVIKPKGGKNERRSLEADEIARLCDIFNKSPKYKFFEVMLKCGLRNSEVANLRGGDIIHKCGYTFLNVRGTKTEAAKRIVPCIMDLPPTKSEEYIFHNSRGGKMTRKAQVLLWNKLKEEANIEAVSYDLRHTYCTALLNIADVRVAQMLMGHTDIRITARYTHATDDILQTVAKNMAKNAMAPWSSG